MSNFTRSPLAYLRTVRRQVFGFGRSHAAAERAVYRRGDATAKIAVEPIAMPEGVMEPVNFRAQGWIVAVDAMAKAGFGRPKAGDVVTVKGENWTVFKAGDNHYARRSYGDDYLLYTKLSGDNP